MARSQQDIYTRLTTGYTNVMQSSLGISVDQSIFLPSNWSIFNITGVIFWTIAGGFAIFEQIFDNYISQIEAQISVAAPQTDLWWQDKILNFFQYDATTPQIVKLNIANGTLAPYYDTIDANKRIVTQCAIVPGVYGTTNVRVAKGGINPTALTTGATSELSALQSFLNTLSIPGIKINATTAAADKLYIGATVTYNGQYASVIQVNVVAAVNAYLRSIPTTGIASPNSPVGVMRLDDLLIAIRAVQGVIKVEFNNVAARKDGNAFVPGTYNLVTGNNWLQDEWQSAIVGAGYIVGETTTGYTLNDSITYNPI